jgi:hypothetical protein
MRRRAGIAVLFALIAGGWALAGDPPCPPWRLGPVGGWCPYGGGLLRWWPPRCFPRCGGPDDYCRKPLPPVCWPPYPPYYIWQLPESAHASCGGCRPTSP